MAKSGLNRDLYNRLVAPIALCIDSSMSFAASGVCAPMLIIFSGWPGQTPDTQTFFTQVCALKLYTDRRETLHIRSSYHTWRSPWYARSLHHFGAENALARRGKRRKVDTEFAVEATQGEAHWRVPGSCSPELQPRSSYSVVVAPKVTRLPS